MGASPSAAFHDFSSEEKAQISRVLQSKYLALKDKQSSDPNDTQLFEALKRYFLVFFIIFPVLTQLLVLMSRLPLISS